MSTLPERDQQERIERQADRIEGERVRLLERDDRHSPAPDCVWHCPAHGPHRFILGCPECRS